MESCRISIKMPELREEKTDSPLEGLSVSIY